jgi:hypothetical protein
VPYKVETGIPIPPPVHRVHRKKSGYPLDEMEVGDCFFVPGKKTEQVSTTYYLKKHPGFRVKRRCVMHNGRLGVRVWRVA